uniref:Uncharacterized protein n=1 Tax=Globodera rostochiensis TaxID=31243 RepID=A0A914GU29_GLORO
MTQSLQHPTPLKLSTVRCRRYSLLFPFCSNLLCFRWRGISSSVGVFVSLMGDSSDDGRRRRVLLIIISIKLLIWHDILGYGNAIQNASNERN